MRAARNRGLYLAALATIVAFQGAASAAAATSSSAARAPGGLAPTPPMGWSSWNRFGCRINEKLIRESADEMISSGMRDAGYQYVNIGDCWQATARDPCYSSCARPFIPIAPKITRQPTITCGHSSATGTRSRSTSMT